MSDDKRNSDDLLADAHNLPATLPGDALGGGFENGEGAQPDANISVAWDASVLAVAHELPDALPGEI
jgi:hypothetical protein